VFVCLQEQEEQFDVRARLEKIFPEIAFDLILLPEATKGPYQTISQAIERGRISGAGLVCDCDHSLGLAPLIEGIDTTPAAECVLPTWSLRGEDLKAWSVASVDESGRVRAIAEKRIPPGAGNFVGVIGCYYFADLARLPQLGVVEEKAFVSDAIRALLESGGSVHATPLTQALFFGDQAHLLKARAEIASPHGTIFCDLDGTVIKHQDTPSYDKPLELLPGALDKIKEWIRAGFHIVLTTSRNAADEPILRQFLNDAGVPHHKLVSGLPSGPRYIVNDRKPSAIFHPQVGAFEVERNQGIQHIDLPSPRHVHVIKRFNGGSLAETLLLEDHEKVFVRKRISKRENLAMGFAKLKQQFRMLERFSHLAPDLIPQLYGDHNDSLEYFYDLQFLPEHKMLSHATAEEQRMGLTHVLPILEERVYSQRGGTANGQEWLEGHLAEKIYPKLDLLREHAVFGRLIYGDGVVLDGTVYPTLWNSLARLTAPGVSYRFEPGFYSLTHGDMTFGNILLCDQDIKLIDMDSGSSSEPPETDLGKLFQSLVGKYEHWEDRRGSLVTLENDHTIVQDFALESTDEETLLVTVEHWTRILRNSSDQVYEKALFYMGLHFIRMIPYRMKISEDQALFALVNAIKWLGKLSTSEVNGKAPALAPSSH
jgi:predicted mannosyl-3-phosphoglycerate phosphatase (HAD superfamily)